MNSYGNAAINLHNSAELAVYIKAQIIVFQMDKNLAIFFPNKSYHDVSNTFYFSCWTYHGQLLYFHHFREKETEAQNKQISQKELLSMCNVSLVLGLEKKLKVNFLPYVNLPCGVKVSPWPGVLREDLVEDQSSELRLQKETVTAKIPKQS